MTIDQRLFLPSALVLSMAWVSPVVAQDPTETSVQAVPPFSGRVLTTGLASPWEITWGPDNYLWLTERAGRRVTRVDPKTGEKSTAVTIGNTSAGDQHEELLGMALHPGLLQGSGTDFVYVAYTYEAALGETTGRRAKIVRFTYNRIAHSLGEPKEILAGIPAGPDHNGGRLAFGPDGMLYYTNGDQGGNHSANFCQPIRAQVLPTAEEISSRDWSSYTGKILRLTPDGGIPPDNPTIKGVQSHIYSYGHRNPQGIAFGPDGKLYSSEHGPSSDDEINLIEAGKNYGWPHVAGYRDGQAYTYQNWSAASNCESLTWNNLASPDVVPKQKETEWNSPDFQEPLITMYTVPNTQNFEDADCKGVFFICSPTIAPSGIEFYPNNGGIPRWGNSLLTTTLKHGALYRFKLTANGRSIKDVEQMFVTVNRYRDLTLGPDKKTIYIVTDNEGSTRDIKGGATDKLANPGAILELKYSGTSPAPDAVPPHILNSRGN
jgi:PQQ-dependent dehydrogenase (s-GDH family)